MLQKYDDYTFTKGLSKVKNQHLLNGRTDFLVTIIEFLRFLNDNRNHYPEFDGRTDPNCTKALLKKNMLYGG